METKENSENGMLLSSKVESAEVFDPILDKDEVIQRVIKPKKSRLFWSIFFHGLYGMFLLGIVLAFILGSVFGEELGDGGVELNILAFCMGFVVALVLGLIVSSIFYALAYKKTFYAYSNKRVIVRKGIIGVDYKSLDMSMIGAVTVNVSVLDKLMKNTGTIFFGSMANPILASSQVFKFAHIENPYDVYKEIKSVIDTKKNSDI